MSERILVVDDDVAFGQSVLAQLRNCGMNAEYMESPHGALNSVKKGRFDIVLVDLHMPHINGIDLANIIMNRQPSIITIIMTGAGTVDDYLRSRSAGVSEFINKPFNVSTFVRMIESINKKG